MVQISEEEISFVVGSILNRPDWCDTIESIPNYIARDSDGWWSVFRLKPVLNRSNNYKPVGDDRKILLCLSDTTMFPCCIPVGQPETKE